MKSKKEDLQLVINEIDMQEIRFNVLGVSPMIMNRYSFKAWQELLLPGQRENRASLEQTLKHDPVAEFRAAFYRNRDPARKSLFHIPNRSFHGALGAAALDIPGAARTQIERLTSVVDINIDLYGVPQLFCAMVRNSGINKTPDVRTRPIFPEWACAVTVQYMKGALTERTVANLFGAAGVIAGIGDWRPGKGGPFGKFKLVDDRDAKFKSIVAKQGRGPQQKAVDQPIFFDEDTAELIAWFEAEVRRREMTDQLGKKHRKQPNVRVHLENKGSKNGAGDYAGVE